MSDRELKDTSDPPKSYLYIYLDNEERFKSKFYEKLSFPIVYFPFICHKIQAESEYGAHIS
jgi:hypothetical protein